MANDDAKKKLTEWTVDDVADWLERKHFSEQIANKFIRHQIDGMALSMLTEKDLRDTPFSLPLLGDIKHLAYEISKLQESEGTNFRFPSSYMHRSPTRPHRFDSELSNASDQDYPIYSEPQTSEINGKFCCNPKPEFLKLIISAVYCYTVFLVTAFSMAVVHDRVPDMKKYPPLPDIVLDNLPHIPWAFSMCELTGIILSVITTVVLIFHKHRFIILRRLFSLAGTIFLLRAFTMWITSLSVPGYHLDCKPQRYGDVWAKLGRAIAISKGFGMSLQGVRTCGDYMFSGHTVAVTLLNFFIVEYSPRRFHFLHTCTWILNIFAIFFILAAHEHYSIDVFIAYYITSRLFLYYHTLANNKALLQPDSKRTRIWFPLFSYFESNIDGMIPNQYEWPVKLPKWLYDSDKENEKEE